MLHSRSLHAGWLLAIAGLLCLVAAAPVPDPIAVPYAAERKLLPTTFTRYEWNDASRKRDIPAKVYFPTDAAGPFPIIIFSHGLGGTRETYEYLGRQWAAHGYVVLHLQHRGSDDSAWRGQDRPMESMTRAASAQNSVDRAKDVAFALNQLETINAGDPRLKGKLDLKSIGISGHSFGAQTALLVSGQRLGGARFVDRFGKLTEDRIKAAIPMSAPVPALKNDLDATYANIHIPTFHMTGTADDSPIGDTRADERRIPFDHITAERYLLTFTGGDHMVFSGRVVDRPNDAAFQKLVRMSSTAFWDKYLKNDSAASKWLDDSLKAEVGQLGTFEHKAPDSPK